MSNYYILAHATTSCGGDTQADPYSAKGNCLLKITMSAVREWAASQGGKLSEAVAVNNLGKWKTATQMTALTILLLTRDSSLSGSGTFVSSGVILLYVSAWFYLFEPMTPAVAHMIVESHMNVESFSAVNSMSSKPAACCNLCIFC
ncbi:hypothetical protein T459_13983 [Capsicum annuum]|uniref:Uncharacterized protein n=1 Tax=Capsicum annuum TaxID=4072 RepID=A0A2G2ZG56_CAPAN|nr:hypothetical protein T459_13983 [Capsicum annuum]